MEKDDFEKNLDNLIQLIEIVLSRNRSSLSIDDLILLKSVRDSLKELKSISNISDRKKVLSNLLPQIIKTFFKVSVFEVLRKYIKVFYD